MKSYSQLREPKALMGEEDEEAWGGALASRETPPPLFFYRQYGQSGERSNPRAVAANHPTNNL